MIQAHSQIANPAAGEMKAVSQEGGSLTQPSVQGGFGDMLLSLLQNMYTAAAGGKANSVEPGSVFPSDGKKATSADAELDGDVIGFDLSALGEFLQSLGINLNEMTQEQWKSGIQNLAGNTPGEVVLGGGSGLNNWHSGKGIGKNIQMLLEGLEKQGLKINSLPKLSYEELQKLEATLEKIKSNVVEQSEVASKRDSARIADVNRVFGKAADLQTEAGQTGQKELVNGSNVQQGKALYSDANQQLNLNDMPEGTNDDNRDSETTKANASAPKMRPEDFKNFVEVSLEGENSKSKQNSSLGNFHTNNNINQNNSKEYPGNPAGTVERENKTISNPQKMERIFQQLQQLNGKISITNNSNEKSDLKSASLSRNSKTEINTSRGFLLKTETGWEIKGEPDSELGGGEEKDPMSELKSAGRNQEFSLRGRFESNENNSFETPRVNVSNTSAAGIEPPESAPGSKHIWGQEKEIIRQISQGIISVEKEGVKEIKINLHPASLGKIKIVMEMLGDKINGKIEVENDEVRRVVEHNLHKLKESALQHQVRLDSIEVSVDPDKSHNAARQEREGKWGQNLNQGNGREQQKKGGFGGGSDNEHSQRDTRRRWGYNTLELVA